MEQVPGDGVEAGPAGQGHRLLQLRPEGGQDPFDTVGTVDGEAPEDGTADQHRAGPERQRLEHVRTAADATVDEDLALGRHGGDDLGQRVQRRYHAVELAAAVGGDDQPRHPEIGRPPGVLRGEYALEHQRQAGQRTQPGQVLPGERGVMVQRGVFGQGGVAGPALVQPGPLAVVQVGRPDVRRQAEPIAQVALAARHPRGVDGDHQGPVAGGFGAPYEGLGDLSAAHHVQLQPQRAGRGPRGLLERLAREGAGDGERTHRTGRAGGGDLAVRMDQPVVGHRRDTDGDRHRPAEQCGAQLEVGHVDESPRTQPVAVVGLAVLAQRHLVTAATGDVVPYGPVEPGACRRCVVPGGQERVLRGIVRLGPPGHRSGHPSVLAAAPTGTPASGPSARSRSTAS